MRAIKIANVKAKIFNGYSRNITRPGILWTRLTNEKRPSHTVSTTHLGISVIMPLFAMWPWGRGVRPILQECCGDIILIRVVILNIAQKRIAQGNMLGIAGVCRISCSKSGYSLADSGILS